MPDKYKIDSHKLMYHTKRVTQWFDAYQDWKKAKSIYPLYLEISPVGYCNHRCIFCALDYMEYQHQKLDSVMLKSRLKEMAKLGIKSIMFAGEGEPTLHPDLPGILDVCSENNIDTALTTNMVPFTKKNSESFIKNCKWIKVSINAGNKEAYAKIHQTNKNDFNRVIENMKYCVELKKSKNYKCTLGAQLLLIPENRDNVVALAKLTKKIGFDYIVVKPYSQHLLSKTTRYETIDYSSYLYLQKELKKIKSDNFNVIFRIHTMKKLKKTEDRYEKCNAVPFFWAYIQANGDVYGCSAFLSNPAFCYGNIYKNTFKEIWEGKQRKKGFEFVHNQLNIKDCRINCRMDEVNRYLWEILNPSEHVNFI